MPHPVRSLVAASVAAVSLFAATPSRAQIYQADFPPEEFRARWERVFDRIGADAVAVVQGFSLPAGFTVPRQVNSFYYLSGIETPGAYLLLDGRTRQATLFLPPRNERLERNEGKLLAAEDADTVASLVGVNAVRPTTAMGAGWPVGEARAAAIYAEFAPAEGWAESRYELEQAAAAVNTDPWDGRLPRHAHFLQLLRTRHPRVEVRDLTPILDELRSVKSPREVALVRRASQLAGLALLEAMRSTEPGVWEYQLDAAARYVYQVNGARLDAYRSITASGTENIDNGPTPDYHSSKGSISGVLYLKDGRTQFSGVNVIARNVNNPLFDAVSAMSGDQTQGQIGPDGRFTINNLTPGQDYVVYIEQIVAGGYPTTPQRLASQAEYWDAAEGTSPATDLPCNATPIRAAAGVTTRADLYFNGYKQGVDFVPIVSAFLTDLAKDGKKAAGLSNATAFVWDQNKGITLLPEEFRATNGSMTRNGQKMLVNWDPDGNGISAATLWSPTGATVLGDLNGDTCGSGSTSGKSSSYGWAVDDSGKTAVGLAYKDVDGNGTCAQSFKGEIVPFIWTARAGVRELDWAALPAASTQYVRAHAISGNGRVVLGGAPAGSRAVAWVDGGAIVDLNARFGSRDVYAANYDGTQVALQTYTGSKVDQVVLWNPFARVGSDTRAIGGLRWCIDVPFLRFGVDQCATLGADAIFNSVGMVPLLLTDMTDDGGIVIGRAGSFNAGFTGVIWLDGIGWMKWTDFFRKQGVAEAYAVPFDNPIAISASGTEVVGGIAGAAFSWWVNIDQVFVCESGVSVQTGFPGGLREKLAQGAAFGRCEHIQ
jgi:hypothetical protein